MLNQRRGLTENLLGKIGLSIITFLVGAIFSAGIAYEQLREMTKDISELKAETYSHEDGKLLELKVDNIIQQHMAMKQTMEEWQKNFISGQWKIVDPPGPLPPSGRGSRMGEGVSQAPKAFVKK